jgi:hypothetical protein
MRLDPDLSPFFDVEDAYGEGGLTVIGQEALTSVLCDLPVRPDRPWDSALEEHWESEFRGAGGYERQTGRTSLHWMARRFHVRTTGTKAELVRRLVAVMGQRIDYGCDFSERLRDERDWRTQRWQVHERQRAERERRERELSELWQAARKAARRKEQQKQKDKELERLWEKQCNNEARDKRAQMRKRRVGDELLTPDISAEAKSYGDLSIDLVHRILVCLDARDLCRVQIALGVTRQHAFAAAQERIAAEGCHRGCTGSRVAVTPWVSRGLAAPSPLALLHELELLLAPLEFTAAPPNVSILPLNGGTGSGPPPNALVVVRQRAGRVSAVCGRAVMRAGIHQANFTMQTIERGELPGWGARPTHARVAIVRSDFKACGGAAATRSPFGYGMCCTGGVWHHDGASRNPPGWPALKWKDGDTVGLRFDADRGTLTGYLNGTRLGILYDGLADALASEGRQPLGFCWCVDLIFEDTAVSISAGKLPDSPHIMRRLSLLAIIHMLCVGYEQHLVDVVAVSCFGFCMADSNAHAYG